MILEGLVELDEKRLWHDGLMEFVGRGNKFELIWMIGVALKRPRHWQNARVQRLGSVLGPGYRCAANIDETFVVIEVEMTMEELNPQEIVDIMFSEDAGKDRIHNGSSITLFELGVGIVKGGERIERCGRVRLKN
jgi:hypothetical protein